MPAINIDPRLLAVAIDELPNVIAYLKGLFHQAHPDAPAPTDAEIIAAYESAFQSSLAKDDAWLAAHPDGAAS